MEMVIGSKMDPAASEKKIESDSKYVQINSKSLTKSSHG